jgi:hypothetical protein
MIDIAKKKVVGHSIIKYRVLRNLDNYMPKEGEDRPFMSNKK